MVDWTGTTTFEVDLLNRITKTTDTKGNVVGYTYDATGNQTSVSYPDGTTTTKTYDLLGQLKTVTETDGRTTTYTYDGMGRISKMEYPHGWVEDYHYDSIGQLLKVEDTDPSGKDMKQQKHVYEYDDCGNMVYEYMRGNGTGEATVENTYTYDALHRIVSVHENYGNDNRSYTYDSLGNLTYETSQGNKSVDYKLNNLNQITSSSDDGWKTSTTYTYDLRGNLIQKLYIKNNKQSVTGAYTYDETNKMVKGVNDIGESSEYLYNGLGALVENTWIIKKNAYGYHDVSALVEDGMVDGEIVVDKQSGKKDKKEKKSQEEVAASPELNKTSTVVKQFVVDYTSETYEPLMEHEVNGLDYRYVYGNDRLSVNITGVENGSAKLIENGNQIRLYYHMDYLGTADYLTSPVSLKVESWTHYNEWGEITHNAVLKCGQRELDLVKRYATHDFDAVLNQYYAKARFYDAENRHFTAMDPILDPSQYSIKEYVDNPVQLVQYIYTNNNPIVYVDPTGENAKSYAAYWTGTSWGLCALDGPFPVGDLIYVGGIGVAVVISNWEQISRLTVDTIRTLKNGVSSGLKWVGGKVVDGLDWIGGKVQSAIDSVSGYFQSVVCNAKASVQAQIEKKESKVIAKVKAARNNFYNFFEIWFDIIGAPIIGRGLSRTKAISRMRHGLNVITYFRSVAQSAANEAGGGRAMHHQRHGGAGYFNHFHIKNHANSAHIFYIV